VVHAKFFPQELLLALDVDSMYRLVAVLGGKKIRIPTARELDSLIGAVVSVSKMVLEGKPLNKSLQESKEDLNLVFSDKVNIQYFVSKCLESFNIFDADKPSSPLINILANSIKTLDTLFKSMEKKSSTASPEILLDQYIKLSESFSKFTDSLVSISSVFAEQNASPTVTPVIIKPPVQEIAMETYG
jgi:hypothetical protein